MLRVFVSSVLSKKGGELKNRVIIFGTSGFYVQTAFEMIRLFVCKHQIVFSKNAF